MGDNKKINPKLVGSVFLYIALYLIINYILSLAFYYFPNFFQTIALIFNKVPETLSFFILFLIQEFILLLLLALSLAYVFGKKSLFIKIGNFFKKQFKWYGWGKFWIYVIGGFVFYIFFNIGLQEILFYYKINLPGFYGEQVVGEFLKNLNIFNFWDYLLLILSVTIIGPIVEEIIYRGFITKALIDNYGSIAGLITSSFLFAFVHFEWAIIGNLFILSLILSYIYYKTQSLIYSFAFHFIVNMLVILAMFIG